MKHLVFPLAFLVASCGGPSAADIVIRDGWARSTAPSQSAGAIYATIENRGGSPDRLTGVVTTSATMVMIHESRNENGISRMRMVDGLDIPAGSKVELKPGGTHVMIEGLTAPLVAGQRFDIKVTFDKSGERTVPVSVIAAGAR